MSRMPFASSPSPRRTIATRSARWAIVLAHRLAGLGVRPNDISAASVAFAIAGAASFASVSQVAAGSRATALVVAAGCVQLRLLCNMLDGMLAVEEGLGSRVGVLFNEIPDRVADVCLLVGAGCAARELPLGLTLGWTAAVLALGTAYVRLLAGSLGLTQSFAGPMAKPHRMFTLTVATLAAAVESLYRLPPHAIRLGLGVIASLTTVTLVRRTTRLVAELEAQ